MSSITGHMIVKNEDKWVYFAIISVLPFVDKLIIFDTGSTDKTVKTIKLVKSSKIIFQEKGIQDKDGIVKLRNEQIKLTSTGWILVIDGDEVWPKAELKKLIDCAKEYKNTKAIFNRTRNCLGDIYHYQPYEFGEYKIAGVKGNLNIRLIKNSKDLTVIGGYPLESFSDSGGPLEKQDKFLKFCDCWYLHMTFLERSSRGRVGTLSNQGRPKLVQVGIKMENDKLPEVFFGKTPDIVENPLQKRGMVYELKARMLAPLIFLKRMMRI